MKKFVLSAVMLFLFSCIGYAHFETGNSLYEKLKLELTGTTKDFGDRMFAFGYVVAVFDSYEGLLWEEPLGITQGQVRDVAIRYLEEHPESRHEPAKNLLMAAFREAFPIKKEGDKKGGAK